MKRLTFAAVLLALSASAALAQPAPSGKCALNLEFDRINTVQLPSGQRNTFLGGNVVARCPSQKMVLKSDSLEVYGAGLKDGAVLLLNASDELKNGTEIKAAL